VSSALEEPLPKATALRQNYPNPFNPTTTVDFTLKSAEFVTLTVFDLLGREVAVLLRGQKAAGTYSVRFEGAALASGMYFCRLEAGKYTATRKMLLLR
jgi:hypothetical protein